MKAIKGNFVSNPKKNEDTTGNANGQPGNVDDRVDGTSAHGAQGNEEEVS